MKYLSVGNDAKTVKGQKKGYLTGILYLAPHTLAGGKTLCPFSTAGCRAVCLYTAGRGAFTMVQEARIRKTKAYLADPYQFATDLIEDVNELVRIAAKRGMTPAVRLNGTTDIKWEQHGVMQAFPDVQFYDYTKWPCGTRMSIPNNYHLTYSFSEKVRAPLDAVGWKMRGFNTSVVFYGGLPKTFRLAPHFHYEWPVIDGDLSDLRFTDPKGVIVGLKAKGKARGVVDLSDGFVQVGVTK